MWKISVTLLLAVAFCLGWTAFNAAQAASDHRWNQRSDAHYRGYGHVPPPNYGYDRHPRPQPHRHYYPVRSHHPYPGSYAPHYHGHRSYPAGWQVAPPPPRLHHYHGGY
ncbi:MAG: hypothetical protein HY892_14230 [Deltaproteobacteria bacterium]|nr:hypothetical protein [Deltaproteobacteria bacterium]